MSKGQLVMVLIVVILAAVMAANAPEIATQEAPCSPHELTC